MKPDAKQVLRRALVLSCVAGRGLIEAKTQIEAREQTRNDFLAWFQSRNLQADSEPEEIRLLNAPVGTLEQQDAIDAGWRCEGVAVLAWALGLTELGPFWEQIPDPRDAVGLVGYMDDTRADELEGDASLRPENEIEQYAEFILNVHWRLRDVSFRSKGVPHDCRGLFSEEMKGRCPGFAPPILSANGNDLVLDDQPMYLASAERIRAASSIVRERHRAANWLIGDEGSYCEVSLDT